MPTHPESHESPLYDSNPPNGYKRASRWLFIASGVLGLVLVALIGTSLSLSGQPLTLAAITEWLAERQVPEATPEEEIPVEEELSYAMGAAPLVTTSQFGQNTYRFTELGTHPEQFYSDYFSSPVEEVTTLAAKQQWITNFRDLLGIYRTRQAVDDNFTMRVTDLRTNETLEIAVLTEERQRYRDTGEASWTEIDKLRRQRTRELSKKYRARGLEGGDFTIKWGRANQIVEARMRELPFIEYEVMLAQALGLSLLATEIGTVETFNDDRLVSSVGARSRYQMMPSVLRQNGVRQYTLRTTSGKRVKVNEEWHPLMTMESAFRVLRGYANAVGHEIPGISSYHTGPGNMYNLYRYFIEANPELVRNDSVSVMDAYIWGVTDGFATVSENTSFKTHSRGYVPSAYGAFYATEALPIDTTYTLKVERVELRTNERLLLSAVLERLDLPETRALLPEYLQDEPVYPLFRKLNPHLDLPARDTLPDGFNVRFVANVDQAEVQFFLPLGASALTSFNELNVLDPNEREVYDRNRYQLFTLEYGPADLEYARLVKDIEGFGFTESNRVKLRALADTFERLHGENPSPFRETQLAIIRTHRQIWGSGVWEKLAAAVP
ncbi:MAG: hypothetical protein RhofKO_04960 [Rhodothermales bacterium]